MSQLPPDVPAPKRQKRGVPEGLWLQCDDCKATVFSNTDSVASVCGRRSLYSRHIAAIALPARRVSDASEREYPEEVDS